MKALEELSSQINNELQDEVEQVLTQIGSDIKMLRGTESQMLAKNGDFLDKLSKVMAEMEAQMKSITEVTAVVKADAKEDGYLWD
jgi:predicted site-specific integrase-resolvase